eukprot:TRINITY_DN3080_c0_g1_i1.p1 TRINITY_DN3080_c0_g1~~TRINITY_DN3080_c0_g1_i1.p1  ORF type:complete len:362 (-),score=70.17 TRINITY_DN3080_c0_g1_i1:283-1368(-)
MEEPERRKISRKRSFSENNTFRQMGQLRKQIRALSGEVNFEQADLSIETTRLRLSHCLKRNEVLREAIMREREFESNIHRQLKEEFEAARVNQSQEQTLEGDEWNEAIIATIRERVHLEAEAKTTKGQLDSRHEQVMREKITYKIGNKIVCGLEGGRIGIQYDTSFAGEHCEVYYCVLQSRSFLHKMHVSEHTIPPFLPLNQMEANYLSSNAMKFIDQVGEMLQAFVDRREQVRLLKKLYGNQIGELFHSLPFDGIHFVMKEFNRKVTVSLSYDDICSELPTQSKVLAWPLGHFKEGDAIGGQGGRAGITREIPCRLAYAEDALRTISLPQAYAEIGLNLQGTLRHGCPSPALPVQKSGTD